MPTNCSTKFLAQIPIMATTSPAATAALSSPLFRRPNAPIPHPPALFPPPKPALTLAFAAAPAARRVLACHVAIDTDAPSSSSAADEEAEALAKVGRRVRVSVPLKVYHVLKAPELDLNGMEGVIKQYVGVWKGKKISANLPFKVEFLVPGGVAGPRGPPKFVAHLREDEFEYLPED